MACYKHFYERIIMLINNYNLISPPIGVGLFSYVYLAVDTVGNEYAVKVQSNINMAKSEVSIMKKYNKHPFLPTIFDFFIDNNRAYIVMNYFKGSKLGIDNYNTPGNIKNKETAIKVTRSILEGLKHLHSKGIYHNDIKPKSILIDDQEPEKILIIDYGLSEYISNKQLNGFLYDNDLYNTALICIYLINGVVSQTPMRDIKLIDKSLKQVLTKEIQTDHHKRYKTAAEFIDALKEM